MSFADIEPGPASASASASLLGTWMSEAFTGRRASAHARPMPDIHLPTSLAFDHFCRALDAEGLRSALAYLACLSDYRCVGIFRIEQGRAEVVAHVDRRQPHAGLDRVPEAVVGSCHVHDRRGVLTTVDALRGQGVAGGPDACRSLPILDPEGVLLGSLCHHDAATPGGEPPDLSLLLQVTSEIARRRLLSPLGRTTDAGETDARDAPRHLRVDLH